MLLSLQYKTNPYGSFILERKWKQIFALIFVAAQMQTNVNIKLDSLFSVFRPQNCATLLAGGQGFLPSCPVAGVSSSSSAGGAL